MFLSFETVYVFELFWKKKSSYVSGVSVCIFVALSVWMCVAGANKVEGTLHCCGKGQTRVLFNLNRHFGYLQFCRLLLRLKVFRSIKFLISLWFKRWVQWCSCLRVHILVWLLVQDTYDLIRLSRTAQRPWIMFHLLQSEV